MKKTLLLALSCLFTLPTWALECTSRYKSAPIMIEGAKVSFAGIPVNARELSSYGETLTKKFHHHMDEVKIFIKNKHEPNMITDYISIRSVQGHEITYPLECVKTNP